jgi:hypothetical protein
MAALASILPVAGIFDRSTKLPFLQFIRTALGIGANPPYPSRPFSSILSSPLFLTGIIVL